MLDVVQSEIEKLVEEFGSSFVGKRILVTGGAGFLGSWLCDIFVESGAGLDSIDNLSTSTMDNIDHLKGKMKIVGSNVEDTTLDGEYDYIFDFASRASPDEYIHHPIETLTANSIGTMKMLELARKCSSVLVHASTSEIYGEPKVVPTPESYYGYSNPIGIRSCYDEGKRFAEALCMAYYNQYKVKVRLPRIFNSYGPRIRADGLYGRALPRFVMQALKNESLTIYGDGKQTRSFCYVSDTLRGILRLATCEKDALVVNIGNPNEITILDLAQKVVKVTKSSSKLAFSPLMQDDPRRRCPDITKAKDLLQWQPMVGLDEGLDKTVEWFETNRA